MSVSINGTGGLTFSDSSVQSTAATGFGFKNRIINGAMMIDQRNAGASVTGSSAVDVFPVDRFLIACSQSSKLTAQQNQGSITPPAGFSNYLGITSSSAYSSTSTDYFFLQQRVEGFNVADLGWGTANAQAITLSFWVRSSLTGTFSGALNNSGSARSYPFSYTVNAANTWEQKVINIAGDTSGTWLTNNGIGIQLRLANLGSGSTRLSTGGSWQSGNYDGVTGSVSLVGTSGATFYITGVQLEKGSTATSFDYRPYGTELALCQRYFETSYELGTAVGAATYNGSTFFQVSSTTTTLFNSQRPFAVTKRATPTMVYYNPATGTSGQIRDMSSNANYTVSSNFNSATTSTGAVVTSASVTANYQYGAHWTASSEL